MADDVTPAIGRETAFAAERLRIDAATAEIVRALAAGGIACLLLKGASFARWLYPEGARSYVDCDLLVAPSAHEAAQAVLERLGFERSFDDRGMPGWWREHAGEWVRREDGVLVDLHREIPGIGVDPEVAWPALWGEAGTMEVGGGAVAVLAERARVLHVVLHVAQHGLRMGKALPDLERALDTVAEPTWRAARDLAQELGAVEPFAAGLQLVGRGPALAERLGLPRTVSAEVLLRAGDAPPVSLGVEQLLLTRGVRARAAMLVRKAFPPPAFIRRWDPGAARGRWALLLAYLKRPLWLAWKAPSGLRAWRAARAAAGAQRSEPSSAGTGGEAGSEESSPRG